MKIVTLLTSLVFALCRVSVCLESQDANFVRFRPLRKFSFDRATIVRIESSSISQTVGHSPIDHAISANSIGHNLIGSPSIDSHYPFDESHAERSVSFQTYKNAMRNLLSSKLSSNLRRSNSTGRPDSHDPAADRPFSFSRQLAYKKLQANKSCRCQLQKSQRIVNGQTAEPNSIPWQVSLAERNSHFCGGSIVNQYFIITAAHCIWDSKAANVQVRVGLHALNDPSISRKTYRVDKIYVHPLYNDKSDASAPGDIGLLKLKTPISYVEGQVEPACLGLTNKRKYSRLLVSLAIKVSDWKDHNSKLRSQINQASGWGSTVPTTSGRKEFPGKLSNVLKKAEFTSKSSCESNSLICIKPISRGQSICDGDR